MDYSPFWRKFEFYEALVERVSYMVFVTTLAVGSVVLVVLAAKAVF